MQKKKPFSSFTIIAAFIALTIIGLSIAPLLNLRLFPGRSKPAVSVYFQMRYANAVVIDSEVTSRLEGILSRVEGLQRVASSTGNGYGWINLEMDKDADMDAVRFEVSTLIRQIYPSLPKSVSYPSIRVNKPDDEEDKAETLMTFTFNGSGSNSSIGNYANDNIIPVVSDIEGVYAVNIYGANRTRVDLVYNRKVLDDIDLTTNDIATQIREYYKNINMGQVCEKDFNNKNTLVPVTFKGWDTDYFDPENIFIKHNERIFRLSELATVKKHEENPRSYYRINGLNTININVRSAPGANQIVIAGLVKKKVEALRQNLPSGYSLNISYDSSVQLKKELNKIVLRIFLSLVILLLFVFIVSRSPRYLLVITISILTNIIIAFILYYLFHIEIHMYSLAGITLSFGIMIDNTIVMIDHLRNGRGTSIFRAILAATLTTMGALLVVFFLDEDMRLRLLDFAWVIIINLAVSLFISLFFIPALLDKIPLRKRRNRRTFKRFRRKVKYTLFYNRTIVFLARFRWAVLLISVLGFGLPAYMLPVQVKGDYWYSKWYNNTIGSKTYLQYIKPVTDVTLGGTLRLFTQKVKHASLTHTDMRTSVNVSATMNDGSTLQQTNVIFEKLENFLAQFDEIELFETRINSPASARIVILFKPEFEFTNFPFSLKSEIESKVIELGSADWFVSGVGRAFDNSLREGNRDSRIVLYGYNLEALKSYAQKVKTYLEEIPRVEQNSIFINGRATQGNNIHREYYLDMDLDKMQRTGISRGSVLYRLSELSKENRVMTMYKNGNAESINLVPDKLNIPDFWEISNKPLKLNNNEITRLAGLGSFYKEREQDLINKENMEYTMVVEFNFIGSFGQKKYIIGEVEKRLAQELKVGYRIKQQYNKGGSWNNDKNDYRQFTLILLVITIIFFICAIVFESLLQPLAVLMMIPMSFIGVFLTFYIFELGFDQGGYAALLLLSGLTVNSALYILNEFNNVRKKFHNITPLRAYLKAFNNKLIPVILTLISTVLGLTPFLSGGKKEAFWFSMASGTIGGLTFSLAAIVIILPLFVKGVKKRKNN